MKKVTKYIPDMLTLCNLLSGCMAICMAFRGGESVGALTGVQWSWFFIGLAAFFDFCDGASARLLHAYSPVGKELDSLSDLISFGVAPGMLMFNVMSAQAGPAWLAYTALFIPAMGAVRLAKFDCDERQTTSFRGLPIPANAIFWIGMCGWIDRYIYPGGWVMAVLIVAVSLLMVCDMPMFSLKFSSFDWRENFRRYVLLIASAAFVIVWGISGLVWAIVLYLLISALGRKQTA